MVKTNFQYLKLLRWITFSGLVLYFSGAIDNIPHITQNVLEWGLPTKESKLLGPFLKVVF